MPHLANLPTTFSSGDLRNIFRNVRCAGFCFGQSQTQGNVLLEFSANGHRHHPPGIKNSKSKSYAEIDTDSLRTRTASVVREFVWVL
jgi:hypothetical protein